MDFFLKFLRTQNMCSALGLSRTMQRDSCLLYKCKKRSLNLKLIQNTVLPLNILSPIWLNATRFVWRNWIVQTAFVETIKRELVRIFVTSAFEFCESDCRLLYCAIRTAVRCLFAGKGPAYQGLEMYAICTLLEIIGLGWGEKPPFLKLQAL